MVGSATESECFARERRLACRFESCRCPSYLKQKGGDNIALDIRAEMEQIRDMYIKDLASGTYNALIVGPKGIGKTSLALTCRQPVLMHSFDPGGTHLPTMAKAIEEGRILVDNRYEKEDGRRPTAYRMWEREFDRLRREDFFRSVGTYWLDSGTMMRDALYNEIAHKTKFASDGVLEIKGWAILVNTIRDMVKLCTGLPCDFIMTGHVTREKDEISGRVLLGYATQPSLQVTIPALFDEYYVMMVDPSDDKKRVLYTSNTDRMSAGTRIGAGKFNPIERPDIKYLLEKAGMPIDDKPLFGGGDVSITNRTG